MRRRHSLALLIAAAALLTACGSSRTIEGTATSPAAPAPIETATAGGADIDATASSNADWAVLEPVVAAYVDSNDMNGAGLAVVTADGGIVYESYWGEFGADRSSFVASMSKQITAGVLLRLDDDGVLDIDAPISDIVGEAWGTGDGDDSLADRTIAQMISHSAGMVGLNDRLYEPYLCQFFGEEIEACGAAVYSTPDDDGDVFEPDSEFVYGGAQWQLAGAIAEYASGESWSELVERIYVKPCGLGEGFGYANHWVGLGEASTGYPASFDGDLSLIEPTDNPHIEGGLYTTVTDYAMTLLPHLRAGECPDGVVFSEDALEKMHVDRIGDVYGGDARTSNKGYGLGWWVDRTSPTLRTFNDGAYGAQAWIDHEAGYGVYLVVEEGGGSGLKDELEPIIDDLIAG